MKINRIVKLKYRNFKIGVKNLMVWFPVIFKDRNWDHQYLYEIIHHKLFLMEMRYRGGDTYIQDDIKIADEIREAKELLNNVIKVKNIDEENPFQKDREDIKKAMEIIGKKSQGWWD